MGQRITDKLVRTLEQPANGNRIVYDTEVKGFGVRVTSSGGKSFVYNYRVRGNGQQRRKTIGPYPSWSVNEARKEATSLRRRVDRGEDPMGELHAERGAPTVADLAEYYQEHHLPQKRPRSRREDEDMLRMFVLPALGRLKVAEVKHADIAKLHRSLGDRPYRANRVVALLSKMFSIAMSPDVAWRLDNPVRGIKRYHEDERDRHLSPAELERLIEALNAHSDQTTANAIRLLLLTGARKSEVLCATWDQFDLERGVWTKDSHHTKQGRKHVVPLSAPALALLSRIKAESDGDFVFPSPRRRGQPLEDVKAAWPQLMKQAGIENFRPHDLRHSYATILASANLSLPLIGQLLGHTRAETTRRYAHLQDDALRAATERVGAVFSSIGNAPAELVELRKKGA